MVLGAFIWFYERTLPSSEERVEIGKKVFRLDKDDVTALSIDSGKGSVRPGNTWWLTAAWVTCSSSPARVKLR